MRRLEALESRHLLAAVIQVRAAGATGEESMSLEIDGLAVETWNNVEGNFADRAFQQFTYTHPTDVTPDQVRVRFLNNGVSAGGGDRNLSVDGITINGTVYESEAPGVASTGTWDASTSCAAGNKQSEVLHCDGYFQFAGSTIEVLAAGATGEESIALQIDGQTVASWSNLGTGFDQRNFVTRSYQHISRVAPREIRVAFTNNGTSASGADRNVLIDAIRLDGITYEAEAPGVFSTGTWDEATSCSAGNKQSEVLHCDGYLEFAGTRVEVRAAGTTGTEDLAILVDDQNVQTFSGVAGDFDAREFQSFVYDSELNLSLDQLKVAFTNNGETNGEDRNLRVDAIVVDGQVYEAEAPSVFSTGTWRASDSCAPGNKSSEVLHCTGSLAFGITTSPGTLSLGASLFSVDEDANSIEIPFVRTGGSDGQVSLDYTTVNGTATAGSDYGARTGTVIFEPGETLKSVTIPITNDSQQEGNETFNVSADAVGGGAALGQPRTATITIVDDDQGPTPGNGNGLLGIYFDDSDLTDAVFERTDATVDFDWGTGSPDSRIGPNTFSVRWDGQIESLYTETYTFYTTSDDGVRLWINDQQVIDNWTDHSSTIDTGTISLQAGLRYDIRLEMYENGGDALAKLEWSSANQTREVVPTSQLYSDPPSNLTGTFSAETILTGLQLPTVIDFAAGDRMFIAQQNGIVRLAENGTLRSAPFIDISDQVNGVRDRGLLGMTVHPSFPAEPYVYLAFTYDPPEAETSGGLAGRDKIGNRVARVIRVTADANNNYRTALANSEVVLLGKNSTWANINRPDRDSTVDFTLAPSCVGVNDCIPADSQSHSIGGLAFGDDGALYVASGDGTSYGRVDPRTVRVQDLDSLSGKLLRIDPVTGEGLTDNPYYNGDPTANQSKVYSYGLRNPFRFALHPTLDEPYIGDVGWTAWEEINTGRGANFGWPYFEGGNGQSLRTGGYQDLSEAQDFYDSGATTTPPLWSRTHSAGARAIVVGDFYTGDQYPNLLDGALFFTDYGEPTIRALLLNPDGSINRVQQVTGNIGTIVAMSNGPDGHMYYVDIAAGRVGRLVYTATAAATSSAGGANGSIIPGASANVAARPSSQVVGVIAGDPTNGEADTIIGRDTTGQWWQLQHAGSGNGSDEYQRTNLGHWSTQVSWRDLQTGDFNGDGVTDVIGRTGAGAWWVGLGDSQGGEFENQLWARWATHVQWHDVKTGDFNGDGRDDIIGRASNGAWWVGVSNGVGFENKRWGRWSPTAQWRHVQVGDFDGDDVSDLIGQAPSGMWWVARSVDGAFESTAWGSWSPRVTWDQVQLGDFNGDGRDDLIGRAANGAWWVSRSTGSSFDIRNWGKWSTRVDWTDILVADFNADGRDDLAGRAPSGAWWVSQATQQQQFQTIPLGYWSSNVTWHDAIAADLSGDGRADVLARTGAGQWWLSTNLGNGFVHQKLAML